MRKVTEKEAKKVLGGKTYKCLYCSLTSTDSYKIYLHMKAMHNYKG